MDTKLRIHEFSDSVASLTSHSVMLLICASILTLAAKFVLFQTDIFFYCHSYRHYVYLNKFHNSNNYKEMCKIIRNIMVSLH